MSKKNRSFLVVSLLPLVLFGSVFAVVQAEEGKIAGDQADPLV